MNKVLARLQEPSTHAGIATALQAASYFAPQYAGIFAMLSVMFGGAAIAAPERAQ